MGIEEKSKEENGAFKRVLYKDISQQNIIASKNKIWSKIIFVD